MKALYAYLDSHGLSKRSKLPKVLAKFSEKKLDKFFSEYRELAKSQAIVRIAETGVTDLYPDSWANQLPLNTIRHLALYVGQLHVHDPLLRAADEYDHLHTHFARIIQVPKRSARVDGFRSEFAEILGPILTLRPLAEAGIVHIAPTVLLDEKREPGALYSRDLYGPTGQLQADGSVKPPVLELPPAFVDYVKSNICLYDAGFKNGQLWISTDRGVSRGNTFAVEFQGDDRPMVYMLSHLSVDPERKTERAIQVHYAIDRGEDKDVDTFRQWVKGESHNYIRDRLNRLYRDLCLAARANARFVTTLQSSSDLAGLYLGAQPQTEPLINAILQITLPYFDGVGMRELAKARENEVAFENFRVAMDKAFREIDKADPQKFQQQADEICRDLIHAPLAKIDERMKGLNRNTWIDGTLQAGKLIGSIVAAGSTLVGTAHGLPEVATTVIGLMGSAGVVNSLEAMAKAYKERRTAESEIRQLPSYFYWQLTKTARRQKKSK